ncbi:ornithine cyclodeaminase [Parabacteroides sp.]
MKIIDFEVINSLALSPSVCLEWVESALRMKYDCCLPSKISLKIDSDIFFNTMPSFIPASGRFGVKVVSRFPKRNPSLQSDILLYDSNSGDTLALMDGSWITAMRTGASAALSIKYLKSSEAKDYAFMGLGNTARATLLCLLSEINTPLHIRLLAYKGQEQLFIDRFREYPNLTFSVYDNTEDLISGADVVVSCVTVAHDLFASDACFKPGVLVVPVHTRGFQNCDLFFDKIYADDTGHVSGFKYFNQFNQFDEFANVLSGKNAGRASDEERILVYNIGIALHDIYFASKIYDMVKDSLPELISNMANEKFWV